MTKITVSLAQMHVIAGDTAHNIEQAQTMVAEASRRKSSVVVLPELFSTGYVLEEAQTHASALDEGIFSDLSSMAVEGNIAIVSSVLGYDGERVANTLPVFDASGERLGVYRKMHLFRLFDEDKYLSQGNDPLLLEMAWGKTGFAICYDLRFPEIFRRYAVTQDASVIIITAEWPLARVEHWRSLLIARAIENQCFIIACNASGDTGDTIMAGHSMIIDPWGRIIIEAGETPQLITAEIDLEEVTKARGKIPIFDDVRRDIYSY